MVLIEDAVIVRVLVRGRVQGVGFRAFTQSEARARDVAGFVRNRRSGEVEAVFAGAAEAVEALCAACRQGPPRALVEALDVMPSDLASLTDVGWQEGFLQLATL